MRAVRIIDGEVVTFDVPETRRSISAGKYYRLTVRDGFEVAESSLDGEHWSEDKRRFISEPLPIPPASTTFFVPATPSPDFYVLELAIVGEDRQRITRFGQYDVSEISMDGGKTWTEVGRRFIGTPLGFGAL